MAAGFAGFSPEAMKFLRALKKNNKREWFQPRKEIFDREWKAPMLELVTALNAEMMKFAPEYVQEPSKAVFRLYRDTRFSKDKTPYKTHISAAMRRRGLSKDGSGSFYFHIDGKEVVIAGGVYGAMPDELRAIREHLSAHHAEFRRMIAARKLASVLGELRGGQLTRVPKGYDAEHPAADLLRRKQFYFMATLDPDLATTPQLFTEILKGFRAAAPAVEFLNRPLLGLAKKDEGRFLREVR